MPGHAAATQRAFEFRCLGPVSLTGPGGGRVGFRTRKHTALLLLLAMRSGRPYPREQLIELLWSDDDEASARHSLSQSVSLINKALGVEAIIQATKDQVVLREGLVELDVTAFEEQVAAKRFGDARELWHGNLLEGLWIQRAPNFERWLDEERERLLRAIRRVLHALVESTRAEGDWEEMRATAEAILHLDALDEAAMLAYLEALSLNGDRTLALRRYREFEARLKDELDAEPGTALRSWIKRHRKGDGAPAQADAAQPVIGRVSETIVLPAARPVFGRNAEYAQLWEAWDAARVANGSFIILQGEPGIGKTALASKLVNQVHVAGGSACFVKSYRSEKSVPFAPVSSLIRQLSRLPGFVALSETWIGELIRLVPELRDRYPNAPQPLAIDDSARYRLCDATLQAAACVADEHPLLIVVDDIQDADEATLALLHYFGRQAATQPTVLLCVARSSEEHSELQRVFYETARSAGFARFLELGALADAEIRRIAHQVLAQRGLEAPEWALEKLTELARGNPLHAGELAMAIPGRDGQPTAEWLQQLKERTGAEETFEKTSTERLTQLSEQARHVAALLAVAGRPLSGYELAAVTALPVAELAAAVTALEDARFIRQSGATLGFAHEQYFLSANAIITEKQRREIHRRLAKHLAKSAAENPAARYEVACHYEGAHRFRDARKQALAAAKYAASVGAVRERAEALRLARRVSIGYDGPLAAELAACLLELRDLEGVTKLIEEARRQPQLPRDLEADYGYFSIATDFYSGRIPLTRIREGLASLIATSPPAFRHESDAQTLLVRTASATGEHVLARQVARRLRRGESLSKGTQRSGHALQASAYIVVKYYWPIRAVPLLEQALRQAQLSNNLGLEQLCRAGLGAAFRQLGRYRQSVQQLLYAAALARRTLNPTDEAARLGDIANAEMALGDFQSAEARFAEAAEIDRRQPGWSFRVFQYVNRGELMLVMGRIDDAESDFERALAEATRMDLWHVALLACAGLSLCAQRRTDNHDLHRLTERLNQLRQGRERVPHERWMVESAVAWNLVLNLEKPLEAICSLERASRELYKRDVDHWLSLELEGIRIREFIGGTRESEKRQWLTKVARRYEAAAIAAEALS